MFPLAPESTSIFILCLSPRESTQWLRIYFLCCFPSLCKDKVLLAQILFLFCKQRSRLLFFFFSIMLAVKFFWFLFPALYELPFLTFFGLWFSGVSLGSGQAVLPFLYLTPF